MLRSLELFGFKSFAERTTFEFDPGITCVVGPNGSGKSNVVDAIKWILGDQSAKSLRGSEMLDVVFNGSAARKPAALAEAIITFDNFAGGDGDETGGRLFDLPDPRVAVGRRLYRSGESEYLINGEAVRLKDVRALFLSGSAGTAAYSIIEQGRVDQILNANAAARRAVFEEAAGVSRFKQQRKEAERRLDTVGQHLTRLSDIVDELETRLAATRSQASKAAKYRDLSRELRTAWLGLAADETQWLDDTAAAAGGELETVAARRDELDATLAKQSARRAELAARLAEAEERLAAADAARAAVRERRAELRSTLKALAAERHAAESEAAERGEQWRAARRQVAVADREAAAAIEQLDHVRASQATREEERAALNELIAENANSQSTADADHAALAERFAEIQTQLDAHTAALQEIRSERTGLNRRRDRIAKRRDTLTASRDALQREIAATKSELTEAESARGCVVDGLAETRRRRDELAAQLAGVVETLGQDTQERTAAIARQTVLRDLQQRGDGIGVGVREIAQRVGNASQPWASIRGLAGELLDCGVGEAPLLDLALGPRSQLVVTTDLAAMVDYLESGAELSGRVGFVELGDASSASSASSGSSTSAGAAGDVSELFRELETFYAASGPDLTHEPGVQRRADELVRGDDGSLARELARRLLADTWIVDRLASARRLGRRHPGVRLLTLAGELIEADGSLHVGPAAPETAVLERRSELRQLAALIARLGRRIADAKRRRDALQSDADALDVELADLEASQPDAHQRAGQARTSFESVQSRLADIERERGELADEADAIDAEQTELDRRQSQADDDRTRQRSERGALQKRLAESDRHRATLAASAAELASERQRLDVAAAQSAERLAAAESTAERLSVAIEAAEAAFTEAAARCSQTQGRRQTACLRWLNARAVSDELAWEEQLAGGDRAALVAARDDGRLAVETLRDEEDAVRTERQRVGQRAGELEMIVRDAAREREQLAERMAEEFDLTLDEVTTIAVEERLSAYAAAVGAMRQSGRLADDADPPPFAELRDGLDGDVQRLRRKIKVLGSVNTDALADLDQLETRHDRLAAQLQDLEEAKSQIEAIIARISEQSERLFLETFEAIRGHFQTLFRKLFGGGQADLVLEQSDDLMECGLDIVARPPGKELRGLSLLSGGEKTMTAVALLLAMFRAKPSPYCLLDEVDAALDEGNIGRFVDTVSEFRDETQFIVITHRKRTMMAADVLYGVTMETAGVSKRMSVHLEEVADDGAIRRRAA